jgi:porin
MRTTPMRTPFFGRARISARRCLVAGAAIGASFGVTLPAHAQSAPGIWQRANLLGTMGGVRTTLGDDGITLSGTDTETLLGNISGGVKQGATMQGVTTVTLQVDTGKAFGLSGGTFNVSALQIHGRSLSPYYLDNLQAANGTEADNATRLWELWYDQAFDHGRADVKFGQQSIDNEFMASKYSALFVNTMAGWPLVPSDDLYAGGPAYPLSSLGARVLFKPADNEAILFGVFDDNPPGGAFADDPQSLDAGGTKFNTNTGGLIIGEFQYATKLSGLAGSYKIGFWYDTGSFPDQAIDNTGRSLANPASSGNPLMRRHNYSLYGVVDQTIWQSTADKSRTLNLFARVMGAPGDRNLIGFAFNGGATITAPLPGRDNDTAGIDIGIGRVGSSIAAYDRALGAYSGTPYPVQGVETLFEATYQMQLTPWWQVQPDIQYVVNPGAGIPDPLNPTHTLRNELVVGVRTNLTF